jgi:hypothetical protein
VNCTFFSLGMLLHGVLLEGEYEDGQIAFAILGLQDEENQ